MFVKLALSSANRYHRVTMGKLPKVRRNPDGTIELVAEVGGASLVLGPDGPLQGSRQPVEALFITRRYAIVDGRVECVNVEIGADFDTPGWNVIRPLRAEDLRHIPLGALIDEDKRSRIEGLEELLADPTTTADVKRRVNAALPEARASLGRTYGLEDLQEVARVYTEAWNAGRPPTAAVARHLGKSKSAAAHIIAKCRAPELGLIPPTSQGKAFAIPTPKRKTKSALSKSGGRKKSTGKGAK